MTSFILYETRGPSSHDSGSLTCARITTAFVDAIKKDLENMDALVHMVAPTQQEIEDYTARVLDPQVKHDIIEYTRKIRNGILTMSFSQTKNIKGDRRIVITNIDKNQMLVPTRVWHVWKESLKRVHRHLEYHLMMSEVIEGSTDDLASILDHPKITDSHRKMVSDYLTLKTIVIPDDATLEALPLDFFTSSVMLNGGDDFIGDYKACPELEKILDEVFDDIQQGFGL